MSETNGTAQSWKIIVPRELCHRILAECGLPAWAVYSVIQGFADAHGNAHPSLATIAKIAHISRTTVQAAIRTLADNGFLEKETRKSEQGGLDFNHYRQSWGRPANGLGVGQQMTQGVGQQMVGGRPANGHEVYPIKRIQEEESLRQQAPQNTLFKGEFEFTPPVPPAPPKITAADIVAAWNALPLPFQKIRGMTEGRRKALAARLKDPEWAGAILEAIRSLPSRAFAAGKGKPKVEGGKAWVASFDWLTKPDSLTLLLEGRYDHVQAAPVPAAEHYAEQVQKAKHQAQNKNYLD